VITILFDTETDGLITNSLMDVKKRPRIMEFFGLKLKYEAGQFEEVEVLNLLMNTGRPVPDDVVTITGIKTADIANKPDFSFFHADLIKFLESADRVVAHNLTYDMSVVEFECERWAKRKPQWPEKVCTVEATEHLKGYRLKLVDLHTELFGEPFTGAHRAETDVRAMTRCYIELIKRGEL
jgi:DNA polymerase-3 subunit alpha